MFSFAFLKAGKGRMPKTSRLGHSDKHNDEDDYGDLDGLESFVFGSE